MKTPSRILRSRLRQRCGRNPFVVACGQLRAADPRGAEPKDAHAHEPTTRVYHLRF